MKEKVEVNMWLNEDAYLFSEASGGLLIECYYLLARELRA